MEKSKLDQFVDNLHPTSTLLSRGTATVMEKYIVPAVLVRNMYGQEVVWGQFNCERGKYKGKRLANNANTDEVEYRED